MRDHRSSSLAAPALGTPALLLLGLLASGVEAGEPGPAASTARGEEEQRVELGFEEALMSADGQGGGLAAAPTGGQPPPGGGRKQESVEMLLAPIPMSGPTLGSGLGLVAGALFPMNREDRDSPPSFAGVGGFKTDNGSWGGGVAHKAYLFRDDLRLLFAGGVADVRYDFYGIGGGAGDAGRSVRLRQDGWAGLAQGLWRVKGRVYLGGRFGTGTVNTRLEREDEEAPDWLPFEGEGLDVRVANLGARLEWDTRDSQFSPTKGHLLEAGLDHSASAWGSDFEYTTVSIAYNRYRSLGDSRVVAARMATKSVAGDPPFFALAQFGADSDLRGYPVGRYRDETLLAAQVELRQKLGKRFGAVLFAGLGGVAPSYGSYSADDLLPSVGLGLRVLVAKRSGVNLRVDYAWGEGSQALYVGVGESF